MEKRPKNLLDQVREVIRLKHYSTRAEKAYVNVISFGIVRKFSDRLLIPQQRNPLTIDIGRFLKRRKFRIR